MEKQLTTLLNKKKHTHKVKMYKKKKGYYFTYSLEFEDCTDIRICDGYENYEEELEKTVAKYIYFRKNHSWLEEHVRQMVERDNRQAVSLGLSPIRFIRLELVDGKTDKCKFWIRAVLELNNREFSEFEIVLNDACLGIGTENYFNRKINSVNGEEWYFEKHGYSDCNTVVFGYPRKIVVNRVFQKGGSIPLTPKQLAEEAGKGVYETDYPKRISGTGHCSCTEGGDFELLSKDDPDVIEGGKRYMQCRICNGWSHL